MQWSNQAIHLLSFIVSFSIISSIIKQSSLPKWFEIENSRKILALAISFAIYFIGTMLVDNYDMSGKASYIIKGILLGISVSCIPFVIPKPNRK